MHTKKQTNSKENKKNTRAKINHKTILNYQKCVLSIFCKVTFKKY